MHLGKQGQRYGRWNHCHQSQNHLWGDGLIGQAYLESQLRSRHPQQSQQVGQKMGQVLDNDQILDPK